MGGKFSRITQVLYENQRRKVRTKRGWTNWIPCKKGLRQGCVLSPLLFAILLDSLQNLLQKNGGPNMGETTIPALFFADDIVLILETPKHLETQIATTNNFCKGKGLQINFEKSKVMVMGKKTPEEVLWVVPGKNGEVEGIIREVPDYKYLGVTIDNNDIFGKHKKNKVNMARGMLQALKARAKQTPAVAWATDELWKQCARAAIMYATEVIPLETTFIKEIEKIQMKAARWATKSTPQSSTSATRAEMGWSTIPQNNRTKKMSYWAKIQSHKEHRWTKVVAKWASTHQGKWISEINNNLLTLQVTNVEKQDAEHIQKIMQSKLKKQERKEWLEKVSSEKMEHYLKKNFRKREKYIDEKKETYGITKLRLKDLETGPEKHSPNCQACKKPRSNIVTHILTECQHTKNLCIERQITRDITEQENKLLSKQEAIRWLLRSTEHENMKRLTDLVKVWEQARAENTDHRN